jgi:hypothetical protein
VCQPVTEEERRKAVEGGGALEAVGGHMPAVPVPPTLLTWVK